MVLGGGSGFFLPSTDKGKRTDGRNLIDEMKAKGYQFAATLDELNQADASKPLLGLFGSSHMKYDLDRPASEPSLAQMTLAAIKQLKDKEKGYFLMVEGGASITPCTTPTPSAPCRIPSPSTTPSRPPSMK